MAEKGEGRGEVGVRGWRLPSTGTTPATTTTATKTTARLPLLAMSAAVTLLLGSLGGVLLPPQQAFASEEKDSDWNNDGYTDYDDRDDDNNNSSSNERDNGTETSAAGESGSRLSLMGALGISLVEGVHVTGVRVNEQQDQVSVTMSAGGGGGTNATDGSTPAVTVAAFKGSMDIMSMLMMHNQNPDKIMMMTSSDETSAAQAKGGERMGSDTTTSATSSGASGMHRAKIAEFIENLHIGSDVVQEGWDSPEQATIGLVAGSMDSEGGEGPSAAGGPEAVLLMVVVMPYTGSETETQMLVTETTS